MQQKKGRSKLCWLAILAFVLCNGVVAQEPGAVQLDPDPETDLVLPKVTLRQLGSDDAAVGLGFYLPFNSDKSQPASFSIGYSIDREKATYRIFDLRSGADEDRFRAHARGESVTANPSALVLDPAEPGKIGFSYGCRECWGQASASVTTLDPFLAELTKTWAVFWFNAYGPPYPGGPCGWSMGGDQGNWAANPSVFLTHWYILQQGGELPRYYSQPPTPFDGSTVRYGTYYNDDFFLCSPEFTFVQSRVSMMLTSSDVYVSTEHRTFGPCGLLLRARVTIDRSGNCFIS
jgi:hypothetical protein